MKNASPLLTVRDLHVSAGDAPIVRGLSLEIQPGEVHAIMGPNGSGKSTFVSALMGHPAYEITKGTATFQGKDLLAMTPDERARTGLFLAFQYPKEIAGVTLRSFLFAACEAQWAARDKNHKKLSPVKFKSMLEAAMKKLSIDPTFADRAVNKGFSGGEKKKAEVLQMAMLKPLLALLDETDSGLDVDALKVVGQGVNALRGPDFSALLVTHYARVLEYVVPDHVHVMIQGTIVESGEADLAQKLERDGYVRYGGKTIPLE